jgi:hypothetical protein
MQAGSNHADATAVRHVGSYDLWNGSGAESNFLMSPHLSGGANKTCNDSNSSPQFCRAKDKIAGKIATIYGSRFNDSKAAGFGLPLSRLDETIRATRLCFEPKFETGFRRDVSRSTSQHESVLECCSSLWSNPKIATARI